MKRPVLIYGIAGGLLIALLKFTEYRFLVVEHSLELYGGLVAVIFAAVGIWLGLKLTRTKETIVVREVEVPVPVNRPFTRDARRNGRFNGTGTST
jgi:two-component system, NarL family, response regulator LiaR